MIAKKFRRLVLVVGAFALALIGAQLVGVGTAAAEPAPQAQTVYYSASGFQSESQQAAQIWNNAVPNLTMVQGGNATIRISATWGGGSRAYPCGLGCATIYIDYNDVYAGHSALRIVSHEIGHGHQLPDNYNGDCSILMSGGSAGTSCNNPYPSSGEASTVNYYYGYYASESEVLLDSSDSGVYDPLSD